MNAYKYKKSASIYDDDDDDDKRLVHIDRSISIACVDFV
jgi:hypothetical protein